MRASVGSESDRTLRVIRRPSTVRAATRLLGLTWDGTDVWVRDPQAPAALVPIKKTDTIASATFDMRFIGVHHAE